jgi:hypothetical protein
MEILTLLGKSKGPLFNARGVHVTREMSSGSVVFPHGLPASFPLDGLDAQIHQTWTTSRCADAVSTPHVIFNGSVPLASQSETRPPCSLVPRPASVTLKGLLAWQA